MGLLEKLPGIDSTDDRTFHYECINCGAEFTSPEADMSSVSCPDCAGTKIRSATPT